MGRNLCGKAVTPDKAYETWRSKDGTWTWKVLKKYQGPEQEAANQYARWFCFVTSPLCPEGEMGDVYVRDIQASAVKEEEDNFEGNRFAESQADQDYWAYRAWEER